MSFLMDTLSTIVGHQSFMTFPDVFQPQYGTWSPFIRNQNTISLLTLTGTVITTTSNSSSTNETVPLAQVIGEVSVTAFQMLSFIILLPIILVLLCCFTRQKAKSHVSTLQDQNFNDKGQLKQQQQEEINHKSKRPYSRNKVILFSILLPSVIILIVVFGLRILNMVAFPVATFVSAEKPIHVRVINALVYCGWALNDWWLVLQFLFVCYIFLETSMKLGYISRRLFKILFGFIVAIPILLGVVVLGYIITVLVDQITKVEQLSSRDETKAGLIFFYSLTTMIFIGCVLSALGYVLWTTYQLVRHLKSSSENSGSHLKKTTRNAITRIVIIVSLVAAIAIFLCVMELISFIGEVSNQSIYFQVISLIGKALATWIFIVGLCILFGPLSEMKQMVKSVIKNINSATPDVQTKRLTKDIGLITSPTNMETCSISSDEKPPLTSQV